MYFLQIPFRKTNQKKRPSWLHRKLTRFYLLLFATFLLSVSFFPLDARPSAEKIQALSLAENPSSTFLNCPVVLHGFIEDSYYAVEVKATNNKGRSTLWFMVDSKKVVSKVKSNGIKVLKYDEFVKTISPESVGALSAAIFRIYRTTEKVYFFEGTPADIFLNESSICIEDYAARKVLLRTKSYNAKFK